MIRKATLEDAEVLASIIRQSFHNVAKRFSLTKNNCPKHPSNCTRSWVESDMERGVAYFILFQNEMPIGCAGVESPSAEVCYLERLSVLPEVRGRHFGIELVHHAIDYAASKGARKLSIGIIAKQDELKAWYRNLGFYKVGVKHFPHLPFQVCYMEHHLHTSK